MVLIVLLGFFALCCALFGVRWLVMRRRGVEEVEGVGVGVGGGEEAKDGSGDADVDSERSVVGQDRTGMKKRGSYDEESEVEAVAVRPRNRTGGSSRVDSDYTASSGRTRIGNDDIAGSRWSLVADDSGFPLVRRSARAAGAGSLSLLPSTSGIRVWSSPSCRPRTCRSNSVAVRNRLMREWIHRLRARTRTSASRASRVWPGLVLRAGGSASSSRLRSRSLGRAS